MLFMLNLKCNIKNNIVTQFDYRGLFKQVTFLHTCDKYTKFQYTIQLFPNLDRIDQCAQTFPLNNINYRLNVL